LLVLLVLLLLLLQVTLLDSLRKRCDFLQATADMLGGYRLAQRLMGSSLRPLGGI
jgi:16S rRNA G527 N7-methylase RsmG